MLLHILWVILKIILIILGAALGLLLILLLLLLFCPVRYRASATKKEPDWKKMEAFAGVSWLFGGISAKLFLENTKPRTSIRIFGIPLEKLLGLRKKKASSRAARTEKKPSEDQKTGVPELAQISGSEQTSSLELPSGAESPSGAEQSTGTKSSSGAEQSTGAESSSGAEQSSGTEASSGTEQSSGTKSSSGTRPPSEPEPSFESGPSPADSSAPKGLIRRILEKLKQAAAAPARLFHSLAALPGRILAKIRKISLTLRRVYDKMKWWKEFVQHPRTQEAIAFVWAHAKGLVKHMLPTRIEGRITFGSEDPCVTGAVLAVLGMTIPFHKNCIEIDPLFEGENILEGTIKLKGRIYGWVLLKTAISVYFNKNVKYVISRWKHKEG